LNRAGRLYVKREDLSGLAFGGNKVRQLEFLLGDAMASGSDVIVHGGAVQSNYCRALAAATNKLGLGCQLILSRTYNQPEDQGNFLLDLISGASIELVDEPLGAKLEALKYRVAERLAAEGRKPYVISYPSSEVLGTIAFVKAALEVQQQFERIADLPEYVVTPAVGATQAGLLLGLRLLGWQGTVLGFAPLRHGEFAIIETISASMRIAATKLGAESLIDQNEIHLLSDYVGEGYARITNESVDAIKLVARTQGVFLDPVYTGKAMAGMLDCFEKKRISSEADVLFIHTGGNTALFAYNQEILSRFSAS
jgi:D-cysteine desulfhydrase family pyridoxal phosphate-dependent enzyme